MKTAESKNSVVFYFIYEFVENYYYIIIVMCPTHKRSLKHINIFYRNNEFL